VALESGICGQFTEAFDAVLAGEGIEVVKIAIGPIVIETQPVRDVARVINEYHQAA
jgi:hypothetical protein